MDCVDLGHGFFLVRFYSKEDLDNVLMRGPSFISIRPWEPFFKPSTANVSLIGFGSVSVNFLLSFMKQRC